MSQCEDHRDVGPSCHHRHKESLPRSVKVKIDSSTSNLHKWLEKWSEAELIKLLDISEHLLWALTLILLDAQRYPVILAV